MDIVYCDNLGLEITKTPDHNSYCIDYGNINKNTIINFQNGSPKNHGVNGVTNEALIAIVIDRIKYQNSKVKSDFNITALEHLEIALKCLEDRMSDRVVRDVVGVYIP